MTQVNIFSSVPAQGSALKSVPQPHSTPAEKSDADARLQLLDTPEEWAAFSFASPSEPDTWTSSVVFEGMHCAACAITLEDALRSVPGVQSAQISGASHRGQIVWSSELTRPSEWMHAVERYGYKALPANDAHAHALRRDEARRMVWRWSVSAMCMMQVMMYAGGLYAGAFQGIDTDLSDALRWTCLIVATPVLFYSGAPILQGAVHDLRRRVLGMDVTVSIALVLAYLASLYNTVTGTGEVYFDSVTMFILFLLLGRFVEMRGRHQTANVTDALARALPATAQRLDPSSGAAAKVPLSELRRGDRIRVGTGQIIPVDGKVLSTTALVDESLVTGESLPNRRAQGEPLLGGSINAGAAITLEVTHLPAESTLHGLVRLLERAQSERPRLGLAAKRMASWFIVRILLLTTLVGLIWYVIDPARAFPARSTWRITDLLNLLGRLKPTSFPPTGGRDGAQEGTRTPTVLPAST